MDRVEIGDWCTLYHADSVEIIDALKHYRPDAVIMDPPYGIGYAHGGGDGIAAKFAGLAVVGDESGGHLSPWFQFPQVILWGADHLRSQLPSGGRFVGWNKLDGRESFDDFSDMEFGWHSRKGRSTFVSHRWKGFDRRRSGGDDGTSCHPMQKPIRIMEWCIEQCRLAPGALILDPYMGSGTTAIAAFKRKMKFVGVEIDRRWFDVAVERIKRQTADGPLFEMPVETQTQPALLAEDGE